MTGFVIRTELYICVFVEVQAKEEGRAAGFGMHGTLQNASDLTWIMDSGSGDWILGKKRARGMARGRYLEERVRVRETRDKAVSNGGKAWRRACACVRLRGQMGAVPGLPLRQPRLDRIN